MIQINCTNCKMLLQIDDAFAGGVCRCRHCGTIQTVPKHLKGGGGNGEAVAEVAAAGSGKGSKTLWQKKGSGVETAGSGTGLDDLAGIVASSGLSSSRLHKKPGGGNATVMRPTKKDHKTVLLLSIAGGVIALLLGVIIFMAVRNKTGSTGDPTVAGGTPPSINTVKPEPPADNKLVFPPPRPPGASFLGQSITETGVVYVIDRGAASQGERFEGLKQAVLASIKSLGPERKFAVTFWQIDTTKVAWPKEKSGITLRDATPANIAEVQKFLDEVTAFGQTNYKPAVDRAFKCPGAEAIVLVPVKAFLPDEFASDVMKSRSAAKSNAKVYSFSLAQPDLADPLKHIAKDTKGAYRDVPLAELRAIAP